MSDLKIRKFPDLILRKKASRVAKVGENERRMLSEMAKAMYLNQGVGLAAVQVGIDKQLAVIDIGTGLINMINPVIVSRKGSEAQEEGCLSVPGACVKVKRAKTVAVDFLNEDGEFRQIKADGLLARAIQHEVDHLAGTLIIDHLNPVKKMLIRRRLKKLDKTPDM